MPGEVQTIHQQCQQNVPLAWPPNQQETYSINQYQETSIYTCNKRLSLPKDSAQKHLDLTFGFK